MAKETLRSLRRSSLILASVFERLSGAIFRSFSFPFVKLRGEVCERRKGKKLEGGEGEKGMERAKEMRGA